VCSHFLCPLVVWISNTGTSFFTLPQCVCHANVTRCAMPMCVQCVFNVCVQCVRHANVTHYNWHVTCLPSSLLPRTNPVLSCLYCLSCLAYTKFLSCLSRPPQGVLYCPVLPLQNFFLACLGLYRVSCIALPLQSFCLACLGPPQGVLHCLAFTKFLSCLSRPPTGCPALPCHYKVSVLLVSAPHRVSCIALPSQSSCLACLGPPQGVFSSRLEKYLVEMYLKEKALFWGAAAAEQLVAQQSAAKNVGNTGQCSA